jgi:arabinose-5-phosphate isomerase
MLLRVRDVMIADDLPTLPRTATMRDAIVQIAHRRGIAIIVDDVCHLLGIITAGDLTRLMERESNVFAVAVTQVMSPTPRFARADELGSAVMHRMEQHGIMAMPVLDGSDAVGGVIHLHDLMRAGVA